MSTLVGQFLTHKGGDVVTVAPSATVFDAVKLMQKHNIGSLVVLNASGKLAGFFTERHALWKVLLEGMAARTTEIQKVMTRKIVCATREMSLEECMELMTRHRVRHLPVVDGEKKVLGIVSIGDLVKFVSSEKDIIIRNLENYIEGVL